MRPVIKYLPLVPVCAWLVAYAASDNLLPNGGFERGGTGW